MSDFPSTTILVVDDSTSLRTILSSHLSNKGFQILTAKDGHEGYKMYKKHQPDLVISDVNMPVWDGFDLCKIIKFDPNYDKTPVALITSSINQEFLIKSISVGADLFLTRPYQESTLITQIQQLIERGGWKPNHEKIENIVFEGQKYEVPTDWKHLSDIMLNAYLAVIHQNTLLQKLSNDLSKANRELTQSKNEIRRILTNTMPEKIVDALMENGTVEPVLHEQVSVMFTDFVSFTRSVGLMQPQELIKNLNHYFSHFDDLVSNYKLEKIKTIGDSYMLASGVPEANPFHAINCLLVAFEMLYFIEKLEFNTEGIHYWPIRIGINSGPLVAGIIGNKRFAYDVWGDNVNIASRIESAAKPNSVFVSEETLKHIHAFVDYEEKFKHQLKDVEDVRIFHILGFKSEFASLESTYKPNSNLLKILSSEENYHNKNSNI